MMMSGLPIVWGEKGAFDPASRPAEAYRALQREFDVRLVDTLEPETLGSGRLLFLAQPQRLSPSELTAVDAWVRRGGRILLLADPALAWPSQLPLGDIRRPPPVSLLAPLLTHWGLELSEGEAGPVDASVGGRRLKLYSPGRLSGGKGCAISPEWLARCRIGQGVAVVVADADLMRDELWKPAGEAPVADNPAALADWLDELAGVERPREAPSTRRFGAAWLLLLLPALCLALWLVRRRRHR
jgi:ABC-type uncharacterized transport system involved in gliding motility auxiliary subunit